MQTIRGWIVAACAVAMLGACGGGGGGGGAAGGGGTACEGSLYGDLGFSVLSTYPGSGVDPVDPASPIVLFLDAAIDPATVDSTTFQVTASSLEGGSVEGIIHFDSDCGRSVITFVARYGFQAGDVISVALPTDGMRTPAGLGIWSAYAFSFTTGTAYAGGTVSLAGGLGFDTALPTGAVCAGDCGWRSAFGDAGPVGGTGGAAYLSSGESNTANADPGVVSATPALGDTTSVLSLYSSDRGTQQLSFDYDFVSDELPEWVGLGFNDVFLVVVVGSAGSLVRVVDSVDRIGGAGITGTFPGMPVDSDVTQHSGLKSYVVNYADYTAVGPPASIHFIVSDVGDTIYPSAVMIDNVTLTD